MSPLTIITQRDHPGGTGVRFDGNGFPHGPGVKYETCPKCGGEGVEYPHADDARECPECQGYGRIPYYRRG